MVLIPKSATAAKKKRPNTYFSNDNSIMVNGESFHTGDAFAFACIRKPGTPWGIMMRDASIVGISGPTAEGEDVRITLSGLSDWKRKTITCNLEQIV